MKKKIVLILAVCTLSVSLLGCSDKEETNNTVTVNENTVVDTKND